MSGGQIITFMKSEVGTFPYSGVLNIQSHTQLVLLQEVKLPLDREGLGTHIDTFGGIIYG